MNHADAEATEEDDLVTGLQLLMKKLTAKDSKTNKNNAGDYQTQGDYQMRKNEARGDPLRRVLRNLVTKGMSARVDETIQEEEDDSQAVQINALKEQLRIFQAQLNKFQNKMRTAPKESHH